MKYNPLLLIDFYKATHAEQYPQGITHIYSPGTPRMSRLKDITEVSYFGGQAFAKEYLIGYFNEFFFNRPIEEVVAEYDRILTATLGPGTYNSQKVRDLHELGYLPIAMYTIPEGRSTAIGVPQSVFVNTHPKFAWLTNTLETAYSSYIWHIQIAVEVGKRYRKIVDKYANLTCDDNVDPARLLGDFSMRGQHCPESAMKASAGWLLSFFNTATVPAIMWLENYYNCDCTKEPVGYGAISTEHSVMCSNYSVDGDEITHIKRLLTEIYPNASFSMVSDSYDYWNLVTNLLPQCRDEILAHNGTLAIRGDSGDPVEIIAGKRINYIDEEDADMLLFEDERFTGKWFEQWCVDNEIEEDGEYYFCYQNVYYKANVSVEWSNERGAWTDNKYYYVDGYAITWRAIEPTAELLGTVWALDQIIGHTINSKGYKVLNPKLKAIYGDSITPQRCEEIYRRLEAQGYAINNVSLGVGSFSFMCLETVDDEGTHYSPYTRDTFGYAIKATYGEDEFNNPIMIQKQPKALAWKKSQKGCIIVAPDGQSYTDGHTLEEAHMSGAENLLQPVFVDGKMVNEISLAEIRNNMYGDKY